MVRRKARHAEIAEAADVSIATVDRVLNARPGVSPYTQRRVWGAVQSLQGQPGKAVGSEAVKRRFDYILPGGPNTFWQLVADGARAAGAELADQGADIHCHLIEGFNADVLAETIHRLGATSDGLAIVALEHPLVREAVTACFHDGVPVVTLVANLTTQNTVGYVGLDNRAAGRTAGYLMGRLLAGREGKIALFEGSLNLSYRDHQERDIGFRDVLRELFPGLTVAFKHPTLDDHEEAYRFTKTLLEQHPEILGIYNVGGGIRGNARALQELRRAKEIVCIGHELTRFTREFLVDGTLDAVIDQAPGFQAREAARVLLEFHTKGANAPRPRRPHVEIFLRENLP